MASSPTTHIHVFPFTLTPEDAPEVLQREAWPVIKPEWAGKTVNVKVLSGGYVNQMAVYHVGESITKEALVVRIFRERCQDWIPRNMEFAHMQIASHVGCGPTVRAAFQNGVIYDYAPGVPLKSADIRDPKMISLVARKLADLHWCDVSSIPLLDLDGAEFTFQIENEHHTHTRLCIDLLPETIRTKKAEYLSKFEDEIDYAASILTELDFPVANAHDDFHMSNILYDEASGDIRFVDYEFACKGNYAVYDFSYIFSLYDYAVFLPKIDFPREPETEETQRLWFTAYLRRMYELQGRNPDDLTEREIQMWMLSCDIMKIIMYPYASSRVLHLSAADLEFDSSAVTDHSRRLYFERKPRLPALCEQYRQLKSQR